MTVRENVDKNKEIICPESTIDSAPRRNFIRKVATLTAAAGVAGILAGNTAKILPESSAKSSGTTACCNLIATHCLVVNNDPFCCGVNYGCLCTSHEFGEANVLSFGFIGCQCGEGLVSGEAIGSARKCGAPNHHGLDFYTAYKKRVSITNCGKVGIGICNPSENLCVVGTILASSCCHVAVAGHTGSAYGLKGIAYKNGCGVYGASACGVGVRGIAISPCAIPIVAQGASGQKANLQQWEGSCGTVYAVINKAGSLGLGGVTNPHHVLCISGKARASSGFGIGPCNGINTTLSVNGSFAAKTRSVSSTTTLQTTDFAILASGTITLTLPPADTQNGMIIFIKNTSTSTVTVDPESGDTIEGAASKPLATQYASLTLISNGVHEWFILSNAT